MLMADPMDNDPPDIRRLNRNGHLRARSRGTMPQAVADFRDGNVQGARLNRSQGAQTGRRSDRRHDT